MKLGDYEKIGLSDRKKALIKSYQQGMISLGKLAEELGTDPVSARIRLKKLEVFSRDQNSSEISHKVNNS